jgi:5-methylcytosine-specific restriction endonuclease McrA
MESEVADYAFDEAIVPMPQKDCARCEAPFPVTEKRSYCLQCARLMWREWSASNKDKIREYDARAREKVRQSPERLERERIRQRAKDARRRCGRRIELLAKGERVSRQKVRARDRLRLLMHQRFACAWCAVLLVDGFDVDHIVPLARGGIHRFDNFQALCRPCHRRKGVKFIEEIQ